jgi:hypothetical protein
MTDQNNIQYLKNLMKNIRKPNTGVLLKMYNKAKHPVAYKLRTPQLKRAQVRSTRKEAIQAAKMLRKRLGLRTLKGHSQNQINLTKINHFVNLR